MWFSRAEVENAVLSKFHCVFHPDSTPLLCGIILLGYGFRGEEGHVVLCVVWADLNHPGAQQTRPLYVPRAFQHQDRVAVTERVLKGYWLVEESSDETTLTSSFILDAPEA